MEEIPNIFGWEAPPFCPSACEPIRESIRILTSSARVTGNDEGWIPFDPLENLREGIFGACSVHEISKEYIQQEAFSSTERTHLDVLTGN